jgi:hypothetical protein
VATNTVTAGGIMTGVGSTTLPAQGLVPTTANRLELVEIAIENTTAVSCIWRLVRWTGGAGTPGASLTSSPKVFEDTTSGIVKQAWTVAPTTVVDLGVRFVIPASIGAGVIRPLNQTGTGVTVSANASWGIGLMLDSGTGQICAVDWTWIEL